MARDSFRQGSPTKEAMTDSRPVIVWFTRDLRLSDNPALRAAAESGRPILAVYVLDEQSEGVRPLGGAARWWLHHSLTALAASLAAKGARLVLRRGRTVPVLTELARETRAAAIHWTRGYGPGDRAIETALRAAAAPRGLALHRFSGRLLFEPEAIRTGQGGRYRVFGPFWRACRAASSPSAPSAAPERLSAFRPEPSSDALDDWGLLPRSPDWSGGLRETWRPGESAAKAALAGFLDEGLGGYSENRDRPDQNGISRLSPYLAFGEISPRQVWHAVRGAADRAGAPEGEAQSFLRQIAWRDFAHHTLWEAPDLACRPLDRRFAAFPWHHSREALAAWQEGRTGYPIIDAGMRELWRTGFMHNRVRMIAASFLIKDLLLPWQAGEAWFWDTLVDACPANNPHNWQWVAGCGTDAAPFFRIFNPVAQGRRFDPQGTYVRQWLPDLAGLPDAHIHAPWDAPQEVLSGAGLRLGEAYPRPLLDHAAARRRALAAFQSIKERAS
jgi:deoxyribodipyrimidine photo-lyase